MIQTGGRAIVCGAGIVGTACAYYLNRSGWQVTLVDQGTFGKGCSHANCGFVCPSHVLPLAIPGAVGRALKSVFKRNAPIYVKPRLDLGLWSWFFRFARRCNELDMLDSGRAIQALLNSSRSLYDALISEEYLDCEWQTDGLLFVFQSQAGMDHYSHVDRLLCESFGVSAVRYDGPELNALEPALKPGLAGGWLYKGDAHLRPDRLLSSWRQVLERRGVKIIERCKVDGLLSENDRCHALVTAQGKMEAEEFVIATGAWTPLLSKQLGCQLPIQPGKGYSITMPRPPLCPRLPMLFEEHHVAVTPMHSGFRLGSTMEFAGYDAALNRRRLDYLREGAGHYLPQCDGGEPIEEWFGWRPMTYDGKPIIDRVPRMGNVTIAAGHNMLGLSMATATGKLVAEMINRAPYHLDARPYRLSRF